LDKKKLQRNKGRLFKIAVGGSVAALGSGVALAQNGPSSPASAEAPSGHVTLDLEDGTVDVNVDEEIAPDLDGDDNGVDEESVDEESVDEPSVAEPSVESVDEPSVDEPSVESVDEPSVDEPSVESVDEPSVESVDDESAEDQGDDDQGEDEQDDDSASGGGDD
jgi:hypothetical protein